MDSSAGLFMLGTLSVCFPLALMLLSYCNLFSIYAVDFVLLWLVLDVINLVFWFWDLLLVGFECWLIT